MTIEEKINHIYDFIKSLDLNEIPIIETPKRMLFVNIELMLKECNHEFNGKPGIYMLYDEKGRVLLMTRSKRLFESARSSYNEIANLEARYDIYAIKDWDIEHYDN